MADANKPFEPYDDVCGECGWLSEENCAVCPMRKWHDAVPKIDRVTRWLDYVRKGGISKEDAMQIALCQDVLELLIGKQ